MLVRETVAPPWLARPLSSALRANRGHHALLIHGPQGAGQYELALLIVQAWLCESDTFGRPCGRCASCLLAGSRNHPDILVLLPQALRVQIGWPSVEDEKADSFDKKPSKDIKVDAVRLAVDFAQTTSARGRSKAVVIFPAERMNAIAANALLKTLEEPPGVTRFVLASSNQQSLPATVRSRCQQLHLSTPQSELACDWLERQGVPQPGQLLAAAGGQPLEALAWAACGLDANTIARLPEAVLCGDASDLGRLPVPRAIELLQKLCHDALLGCVGAPPRYFLELPAMPHAHATRLHSWADALARASRHAEHPWNASLMVESLVLQGRRACQGLPALERSRDAHSIHSTAWQSPIFD